MAASFASEFGYYWGKNKKQNKAKTLISLRADLTVLEVVQIFFLWLEMETLSVLNSKALDFSSNNFYT